MKYKSPHTDAFCCVTVRSTSRTQGCLSWVLFCLVFPFKVTGNRLAQKRLPLSKGQQVRTPWGSPSRADTFPVTWRGYFCSGKLLQAASRGSPTLRNTTTAQPAVVPNRLQPPMIGTLQLSFSITRLLLHYKRLSAAVFWLFFHDEQIWLRENIIVRLKMISIHVLI